MANNYLQFSTYLPLHSEAEQKWCNDTLSSDAYADFGAQWEIDKEGLLLYAEEFGDPDAVVLFVREYLRIFAPLKQFWFAWAFSCSKCRPGEFGGGAAVIGASAVINLDTEQWAQEQIPEGRSANDG